MQDTGPEKGATVLGESGFYVLCMAMPQRLLGFSFREANTEELKQDHELSMEPIYINISPGRRMDFAVLSINQAPAFRCLVTILSWPLFLSPNCLPLLSALCLLPYGIPLSSFVVLFYLR